MNDFWAFVGLIGSLLCLSFLLLFAGYKYGRYFEKQAIRSVLEDAISETYQDGYHDGYAQSVKEHQS